MKWLIILRLSRLVNYYKTDIDPNNSKLTILNNLYPKLTVEAVVIFEIIISGLFGIRCTKQRGVIKNE